MDIYKIKFNTGTYPDDFLLFDEYKKILKVHKNKYGLYDISKKNNTIILGRKINEYDNNKIKEKNYKTGIDILYIDI